MLKGKPRKGYNPGGPEIGMSDIPSEEKNHDKGILDPLQIKTRIFLVNWNLPLKTAAELWVYHLIFFSPYIETNPQNPRV